MTHIKKKKFLKRDLPRFWYQLQVGRILKTTHNNSLRELSELTEKYYTLSLLQGKDTG